MPMKLHTLSRSADVLNPSCRALGGVCLTGTSAMRIHRARLPLSEVVFGQLDDGRHILPRIGLELIHLLLVLTV